MVHIVPVPKVVRRNGAGKLLRLLAALSVATGAARAATTYQATNLQPPGSLVGFANIIGMNNKAQVLGDACNILGAFLYCYGANRFPAVWSNGVITPLPIPTGYSYIAQLSSYGINESGTVVGTVTAAAGSKVVLWSNGVPQILPDAPVPGACSGAGCICSPVPFGNPIRPVNSASYGINAAGHILGSTTYPSYQGGGCSETWVYNGTSFRAVPLAIPHQCIGILPPAYGGGVGEPTVPTFNDADQVLETIQNYFCGPPYAYPNPPVPSQDPAIVQPGGSYSFLPLGSVAAAGGSALNSAGQVMGYYTNGGGTGGLVFWDQNGIHDLGAGGYASLNNAGQMVYLTRSCLACGGGIAIWQNGVSTPVQLPSGVSAAYGPAALNDAGQFIAGGYLLSPAGPCAPDVSSQILVTRGGFRYDRATQRFVQTVTLTNTSLSPVAGPLSVALDGLTPAATLSGIAGATLCGAPAGSPFLNTPAASLAPGASTSLTLDFIDTAQTPITYTTRIIAGSGGR